MPMTGRAARAEPSRTIHATSDKVENQGGKRTERADYLAGAALAVAVQRKANRELTPPERKGTGGVQDYAQANAHYSGDDGHDVFPSNAELADRMGCCRRTVQRRRDRHDALGCGSHTVRRTGPRNNRTHVVHLRPTFGPALEYWTSRRLQNAAKGQRTKADRAAPLVAAAVAGLVEQPSGACPECDFPAPAHHHECSRVRRTGHDPP